MAFKWNEAFLKVNQHAEPSDSTGEIIFFFCHVFFRTLNGTLKNGSVLLVQKRLVNCQNKKIVQAMWHRGAPQDTDTDRPLHLCTDRKSCRPITVKRNKPLTALTPLCCLHIWYFALSFCSAPWQAGRCQLFRWLKVGWKRIYFVSVTAGRGPAEASIVSNREGEAQYKRCAQ